MNQLAVGKIVSAHGLRGEIKVITFTDTPEDFCLIPFIYISRKKYEREKARVADGFVLLKLSEINDRNSAERLKGDIFAQRADITFNKDRFYVIDIIGASVISAGQLIGTIVEVLKYGFVDTYVVDAQTGNFSFPALEMVIEKIDIANNAIYVNEDELAKVMVYEI